MTERGPGRPPLRAVIVTPAPRGSRSGNRVTALRWAALLRVLDVRVRVVTSWNGEPCDLLLAVHAAKSADSVARAAAARPGLRIAVLLAGTDIYPTFAPPPPALAVLERADRLIALQAAAAFVLPAALRAKVRTVVQSAVALRPRRRHDGVQACVLAHLRAVKDPLLPCRALAFVPRELDVHVVAAGRAIDAGAAAAAAAAMRAEPRFRWLGELSRRAARELLAESDVCIIPSAAEGGANVASEAIAAGTPLLATRIPGNTGLLGTDWPGLFDVGDAAGLGALLRRFAADRAFADDLRRRTRDLQPLVHPDRERAALRALLAELGLPAG